jgi:hypothetical protein
MIFRLNKVNGIRFSNFGYILTHEKLMRVDIMIKEWDECLNAI